MSYIRHQLRRGSSTAWTAANPVLEAGEFGLELGATTKLKLGDGAASWNALSYMPIGSVSVSGGTSSALVNNIVFSNSNGVTFGLNGSTLTASVAAGGGGGSVNISAGTTSNNLTNFVLSNSNGLTFGLNGSTITGSHNGLTSQSNQALSAANGSFTFQTATFANSNGISFSTGTQGIYASHNGITSQTNQSLGLYAVSNTTQSSSGTVDARTLSFQGAGNVSVGISNGSVIISATGAGGGGITNVNLSAGTTSQNLSNFVFSNSNGVSFGLNGSTVTGSHNGLTSQSNQALSGSNGSFAFQTATFGNLNGLSFYTSNGSMVASYTVPSVPAQTNQTLGAYAVSNTTQSSSGTFDARSFSIQGAGGVSVGVSNGSVIISGATGGGGGGITNVNLSAGTTSQNLSNFVFSNSNGVSFGLNGSTITASAAGGGGAPGISYWANYKDLGHVTRGVRFGGGTFWNNRPIFVPGYVEGSGLIASRIRFHIERSSNSTFDLTWAAGIYSVVNFSSLSLMGSSSAAFSMTNNTQWNNIRVLDITGMSSLTIPQGHIVIGMHISAQSASTAFADFNFYGANRITPISGYLFAGTNSTGATSSNSIQYPFHGAYSATSAGFPANVVSADLQHGSRINEAIDIYGSGL